MICCGRRVSVCMIVLLSLAEFLQAPTRLFANPPVQFSSTVRPRLELNVRVYSFPGLPFWMLRPAEAEAGRMLHSVHIELKWIDCTSRVLSASCSSPVLPTDLIVRFLIKALPQASPVALGISDSSNDSGAAFIFYDRVLALRTRQTFMPLMLGRVMAHEIAHLLLPEQAHTDLGLMRAHWTADDLRTNNNA